MSVNNSLRNTRRMFIIFAESDYTKKASKQEIIVSYNY